MSEVEDESSTTSTVLSNFLQKYALSFPMNTLSLSLTEKIESIFHLLNEKILRDICTAALQDKGSNAVDLTNGLDVLGCWGKIIDAVSLVISRRRDTAANNLRQIISVGSQGNKLQLDKLLYDLSGNGYLDHILIDILEDTIKACENKSDMEGHLNVLKYASQTISTLNKKLEVFSSSSDLITEESLSKGLPLNAEAVRQQKLIGAGHYINELIKSSNGDIGKLKTTLINDFHSNIIEIPFFHVALQDNIDACIAANYVNKAKLLQFVQNTIRLEESNASIPKQSIEEESSSFDELSTHHAPKFVGDSDKEVAVCNVISPTTFIDASNVSIQEKVKNNKKKSDKKAAKLKVLSLADKVADHLIKNGWAIIDNFVPLDVVRRVKIEAGLFKEHYEQSEIWVGKHADVGAHLSVPNVRGDKVLWLCGGHNSAAPEGVTRSVKTINEIEPCKLQVKAAAPIRRFNAIKELISCCDKIVEELKPKVPFLSAIYERSDAMLANYPGGGSRFARHVDNTTLDGRRLSVLVYLNPTWSKEQGGALRLTKLGSSENGVLRKAEPVTATQEKGRDGEVADAAVDIYPLGGRLAMFLSSEIPHEVLPTFGDRHSVTIWYYDKDERAAAISQAKQAGNAASAAKTSVASQQEAKVFISELLDGKQDDPGSAANELALLRKTVQGMSDEAVGIVASITGAPSLDSFRKGFELLVDEDLKQMRHLFRNMGLS